MISDVRVTFSDGTERDILRKSYPIAPFILAGFAGSVKIGLQLIDHLSSFIPPPDVKDYAWKPEWVAEQWSPYAAKIFEASPKCEQDCGSQILMVGVSPSENMGLPEFPRVYVIKFNWPDFTPIYMEKGMGVYHIGNGSDVKIYEDAIGEFFTLGSSAMMGGLMGGPAGWSAMIATSVARLVEKHPTPGISPHVFVDTVTLGTLEGGNNNQNIHLKDGTKIEFRMPVVATSFEQFEFMCRSVGLTSARAVA